MNIVLDTNIIRKDLRFKSGNYKILIDYLDKTDSTFIIPRIVIDEAIGIYERNLLEKQKNVNSAISRLNKSIEVNDEINNIELDISSEVDEYNKILTAKLKLNRHTVLEYKNELLPEIVKRCINRIKPAKEDGKQFRDVLLWLSIVEYMKTSTSEEITFISENHRDFGIQANIIHPELEKEIRTIGKSIHYYSGYEAFIKEVATPIEFVSKEWLEAQLDLELIQRHITESIIAESDTIVGSIENKLNVDDELDEPSIESTEYYNLIDLEFSVYKLTEGDIYIKTNIEIELEIGYSFIKPVERVNFEYQRTYGYDVNGDLTRSREVVPVREIEYEHTHGYITPVIVSEVLLTVSEGKIINYEFENWR